MEGESFGWTISELGVTDPNGDYILSTTLIDYEDKARASEIALTLVDTSMSAAAINTAALFLSSSNEGWDLGRDVTQGTYFSSELPQIQIMAAAMVACDLSGGCGPDGMYSWAACWNRDMCRPGISMDDVWRRTNSPDVMDAATEIANILRQRRAKG